MRGQHHLNLFRAYVKAWSLLGILSNHRVCTGFIGSDGAAVGSFRVEIAWGRQCRTLARTAPWPDAPRVTAELLSVVAADLGLDDEPMVEQAIRRVRRPLVDVPAWPIGQDEGKAPAA